MTMQWAWLRLIAAMGVMVCLAVPSVAQEFRATVTGRVVDASELAVPGATVTITNTQTAELTSVATTDNGAYSVPFLRPGVYTLRAELAGFKTYLQEKLELQLGQRPPPSTSGWRSGSSASRSRSRPTPWTPPRPIAAWSSTTSASPSCRSTHAIRSCSRRWRPVSPTTARRSTSAPSTMAPFADWWINGGANRNNEFVLDGAPYNALQGGNNIAYVPPVDSVQEFKIITNSYDALRRRDPALGVALRLLPADTPASAIGRARREDYARVMRFLHEKEFVARSAADVARLYQSRGLSTDTGIDACYAVADAIGAMPLDNAVQRILVVGPSVEFGPRTGLDDDSLGQSVQPLPVLDALRATGRAARDISIETLDVNPLVVDVVADASAAAVPPSLVLLSSLSARTHRLVPAYVAWLETWGGDIGVRPSSPQARADGRLRRQVTPARQAWWSISARVGHVALDTIPGPYDVVVATNVLT